MEEAVRKIIHVDMDALYASVEQRDDPSLKGRPVAVGYPEKRGGVAAASYEARQFGVRSALPSTTALRKCPELIFRPPRFEVYKAVSRQIHAVFADYTPLIEPLSLDEAYLDVTDNLRGIPKASATAKEIRARILEETGLTASAGISYNKFIAKLASDFRKPNGQYVVPPEMGEAFVEALPVTKFSPEMGEAFVEALPVTKFYGVGPVTAAKMHTLGIQTGADMKRQSLAFLQAHFGKSGPWYYDIARGRDDRPVRPDRERKSSGSETTFATDLTEPEAIEAGVLAMADDVWAWCEKTGGRGRTVTVKIKWADFQQSTRSRSMAAPVDSRAVLHEASLALIRSVYPPPKGIRLVGVTLSNFASGEAKLADELSLLDESRLSP